MQDRPLQDRICVVTGAASGIGRATARMMAEAGGHIIAADFDSVGLEALAAELGNKVRAVTVNMASRDDVERLADVAAEMGGPDVWVNAAGIVAAPTPVAQVDEATLDRVLAVNLKGVYFGCAAAARLMGERGRGAIVNLSSQGADTPAPGLSCYAMSKAAVNALTRGLAVELGPMGVRVNAVAPGFIDTPMVRYRFTDEAGCEVPDLKQALFEARAAGAALGRIGQPEDIARTILFLASDASSYITGETLRANGGADMR